MREAEFCWPREPDEGDALLVRAAGTNNINNVRAALDAAEISYTMSGSRKDDVSFWVAQGQLQHARREVQSRLR